MKLNPECIRDILATIEAIVDDANQCYTCSIETFIEQNPALQKHPDNVVFYHFQQIWLSGYLYKGKISCSGEVSFMDLSPEGHELLNKLRTPTLLTAVKNFVSITGSASLQQMAVIATDALAKHLPDLMEH